jgi:hypothetical protein
MKAVTLSFRMAVTNCQDKTHYLTETTNILPLYLMMKSVPTLEVSWKLKKTDRLKQLANNPLFW